MSSKAPSSSKNVTAENVGLWHPMTEHIAKIVLYTSVIVWMIWSTSKTHGMHNPSSLEDPSLWEMLRTCLLLYLSWKGITSELDLATKRLSKKLPPGYVGFPIVREVLAMVELVRHGYIPGLARATKKYGKMFTMVAMGQINVVMGDEDDLSFLFKQDRKGLTGPSWPTHIQMLIGPKSMANQMGSYHKTLRKLMDPFFTPKFVENYFDAIDEVTLQQLESWSSKDGFVSSEVFKLYSLRAFYAASFGKIDEEFISSLHDDFKVWLAGFLIPFTNNFPGNPFLESMKARERIHATMDKLIDDFVQEFPEESRRAQTTIVGRLVYAKIDDDDNEGVQRKMTREEIKDNIFLLIFAGHDTTYGSLSSFMYHLSQNPDALAHLSNEVATNFPTPESEFTNEKLNNMPILNACLYESWRMDPPIPHSFRQALTKIQHKGYTFEKGTMFQYLPQMATTNENLYQDSQTFMMERFLPKEHPLYSPATASSVDPSHGRPNYPIFGGGSHVCLGKAFAKMELRVLVVRLIQNYRFEVRNPIKQHAPVNSWNVEFKLTTKTQERK